MEGPGQGGVRLKLRARVSHALSLSGTRGRENRAEQPRTEDTEQDQLGPLLLSPRTLENDPPTSLGLFVMSRKEADPYRFSREDKRLI